MVFGAAAALLCRLAAAQNDCSDEWGDMNLPTVSPPRSQECLAVCACFTSGFCDDDWQGVRPDTTRPPSISHPAIHIALPIALGQDSRVERSTALVS